MTLPDIRHTHDNNCETFFYVARRWCLTHANELLAAQSNIASPVMSVITGLDDILGITPVKPGSLRLLEIKIDHDHAMTTDTSLPPLVVRFIADTSGLDYGPVVIDGWHRLYKLRRQGVHETGLLMLSAEAEQAVRVPITAGARG